MVSVVSWKTAVLRCHRNSKEMNMATMARTWMAGAGMTLLAGCASQATPDTAAQLFDCGALNQAVESAEGGFDDIKGRLDDTRLTRTWETDVQAFHDACLIASARRPDHYACFGRLKLDSPQAALIQGGEGLARCLGKDWTSRQPSAERIEFVRNAAGPVVVLETFLNDRGRRMGTLSVFQKARDAAPMPGDG